MTMKALNKRYIPTRNRGIISAGRDILRVLYFYEIFFLSIRIDM